MIRSLLKGQTPSCEFRYLRGDGTTVDGEVTLNSIILKGERYYHTIIRDITERKQAEEKLRTLTEELKRSNADLAQFAYVASHDLQEPLRMVTSFVQLLQRRYKDKLDKDADEFISFAVEGASWMQKLINDLLKYSRVGTHGKILEKTDCNTVVNHALSNLKKTIDENSALISMEKLPIVMADYTQVVQLFQNLLSNAIKYHSNQQPEIFISSTNREDHWLFSIKDNGIGIDKAYVNKIFIIFQRLHNKSQYPGTGIGLAICKKIVERHGGRIWVESQPGIGSTFYFTIPIPKEG
jgi:light-regulated signal transduction histidine kinase (bacteriophytochrome)